VNILVALEGVLSSDNTDNPNRTGALLYYALRANNRVAIFTSWSKKDAEHWLMVNGFIGYDELIDNTYELIGEELGQRQVNLARSKNPVELVVSADPGLCAWTFGQGLPSLLFANPDTMNLSNRPDSPTKVRAWDSIEAVITKRNIKRSLDASKADTSFTRYE
jgi:hypothetical protein